jgi:hypothetical protein
MNSAATPAPEARLLALLTAARDFDDDHARTQLNHWLRTDPAARAAMARLLVDEQALVSQLQQENLADLMREAPLRRLTEPHSHRTAPRGGARFTWIPWAAAALLILGLSAWHFLGHPVGSAPVPDAPSVPVAVLRDAVDAQWTGTSPAPGSALNPGPLHLASGMAAIEFASGARVLIEGPASLVVQSDNEAFCDAGRLRVHVPPSAHGFTIVTPGLRVVDQGTAFGLSLKPGGETLVKVMDGRVSLHVGQSNARDLTGGRAVSLDGAGRVTERKLADEVFPSEGALAARMRAGNEVRLAAWQRGVARLAADPSTLLCYTFEGADAGTRTVRNHAAGAVPESHGTLVGADVTTGRWEGKQAVEFRGQGDRLPFTVPGTHTALTLMAWVRIDSLPNDHNGLILTTTKEAGAVQWMIEQDGSLRFGMKNGLADAGMIGGWDGPVMAPAVDNLDLGRWMFLATTYDAETGCVSLYRDGKRIGTGTLSRRLPAVVGQVSFGNWANGSSSQQAMRSRSSQLERNFVRNFVGRLDELMLLSRVLSDEEIARRHADGQP